MNNYTNIYERGSSGEGGLGLGDAKDIVARQCWGRGGVGDMSVVTISEGGLGLGDTRVIVTSISKMTKILTVLNSLNSLEWSDMILTVWMGLESE